MLRILAEYPGQRRPCFTMKFCTGASDFMVSRAPQYKVTVLCDPIVTSSSQRSQSLRSSNSHNIYQLALVRTITLFLSPPASELRPAISAHFLPRRSIFQCPPQKFPRCSLSSPSHPRSKCPHATSYTSLPSRPSLHLLCKNLLIDS